MIYLDNNATTPIDERVLEAMMPYFSNQYGNAASNHKFGLEANEAVKKARKQVAELIGSNPNEIIFTSGATEAINLAIKGVVEKNNKKGKHIITATTEHSAVLDTCKYLETKGYEVSYLPVKNDGLIDLKKFRQAFQPDTILVSVMYVNNETGVIQPIDEIAKITHEHGAIFMTDGTQAVGKIPVNMSFSKIDLLAFSGHKFYGPKGIGCLYVKSQGRNRVKVSPLIHGGGHERGLRSGTLNVPLIMGFGKACELARFEMAKNEEHIRELRDFLETRVLRISGTSINGNWNKRLYNVTNIHFKGIDVDSFLIGMNNVMFSNGSACTSASIEPSHVLMAMGLKKNEAFSSFRFSFSKENQITEIRYLLTRLQQILNKSRDSVS